MFEQLRASFRAMLDAARSPDDRRAVLADMKQSLVHARLGLDDLRRGVEQTRRQLATGQQELETLRRRRTMAEGIDDQETVAVASRYEALQAERVRVLEQKLSAQEAEAALVEREVAEMTTDLRRAMDGVPLGAPRAGRSSIDPGAGPTTTTAGTAAATPDPLDPDASLRDEIDALGRVRERAAREETVEERLAALKRRMGK